MTSLPVYIINLQSYAFLPKFDDLGNLQTVVVGKEDIHTVNKTPYDLMSHCLYYYGTDLRANKQSIQQLIGSIHMAPVIVHSFHFLAWFPTKAIRNETCAWLNALAVLEWKPLSTDRCEVTFINGCKIELDISHRKFEHQLKQTYFTFLKYYIRLQFLKNERKLKGNTIHCKLRHDRLGYEIAVPLEVDDE